jgi:hypothetical protein
VHRATLYAVPVGSGVYVMASFNPVLDRKAHIIVDNNEVDRPFIVKWDDRSLD